MCASGHWSYQGFTNDPIVGTFVSHPHMGGVTIIATLVDQNRLPSDRYMPFGHIIQ
jgi:hypothetical protein